MRTQEERIASLHKEIDRIAGTYEIGHTLMAFEIVRDGISHIGLLSNVELGDAPGLFLVRDDGKPELRVTEILLTALNGVMKKGFPRLEIGKDYWSDELAPENKNGN